MKLLLLLLFTVPLFAQEQEKAFDFWVGDWDVSWYDKDSTLIKGTNKIERILDGKVIQESFEDPSRKFRGRSLSVYNPFSNQWHQAWADNQGGYYNFVGDLSNEQRIFITPDMNAQGNVERMIFLDIKDDSFIWKWQGKKKGANEWTDQWIIYYQRKK